MKGRFITLEGTEGVGKTSNLNFIENILRDAGIDVVRTREPGGPPLSETIRKMVLDTHQDDICDDTELLLMFAARAQHLHQLIIPALEAGKWVVCDRFTDATYAYQGGGRGIDQSRIAILEKWVQGDLRPDLTFLLDMPVEDGLARASSRSEPDRFELEKQDFFEHVRHTYLRRAKAEPERVKIIDASPSLDKVQHQIGEVLSEILAQ